MGQVAVEPPNARIYRGQVYEEEYRLAADANLDGLVDATTAQGHPIIDYEALYPNQQPWIDEGKANLRRVELGERNGLAAEVLGGIAEGDQVIVHPSDKINDGVAVAQRSV